MTNKSSLIIILCSIQIIFGQKASLNIDHSKKYLIQSSAQKDKIEQKVIDSSKSDQTLDTAGNPKDSTYILNDKKLQNTMDTDYGFPDKLIMEPLITLSAPLGFMGISVAASLFSYTFGADGAYNALKDREQLAINSLGSIITTLFVSQLFDKLRKSKYKDRLLDRYHRYNIIDRSTNSVPIFHNRGIILGINRFSLRTADPKEQIGFSFGITNEWLSKYNFSLRGRSLFIDWSRCTLEDKRIVGATNTDIVPPDSLSMRESDLYISKTAYDFSIKLNYNFINTSTYKLTAGIGRGWKIYTDMNSQEKNVTQLGTININQSNKVDYYYDYSGNYSYYLPFPYLVYHELSLGFTVNNFRINLIYQRDSEKTDFPIYRSGPAYYLQEQGESLKLLLGLSL